MAANNRAGTISGERDAGRRWHVLWTHSHSEQLVHDQLAAKGFDVFLPKIDTWSRRAGVRRLIRIPMFPSYLFLRHAIDKASYLEVSKVRGVVNVLGERWDHLAIVPDIEIDAIQRVQDSGLAVRPYPYMQLGQRVRISRGPLADVEGVLVRYKLNKGLFVLAVDLLRGAVAVEVDCTHVTAA